MINKQLIERIFYFGRPRMIDGNDSDGPVYSFVPNNEFNEKEIELLINFGFNIEKLSNGIEISGQENFIKLNSSNEKYSGAQEYSNASTKKIKLGKFMLLAATAATVAITAISIASPDYFTGEDIFLMLGVNSLVAIFGGASLMPNEMKKGEFILNAKLKELNETTPKSIEENSTKITKNIPLVREIMRDKYLNVQSENKLNI